VDLNPRQRCRLQLSPTRGRAAVNQSLGRALDLLADLAEEPASLDELSAKASVHKTTVMRLLQAMEEKRFGVRDGHRYRLGPRFFELSSKALEQRGIRAIAHPHLAALNAAIGHTVHLAAFEGGEVVYIDKFESRHPIRMYSRIGLIASLHSPAVARVLLANLPRGRQEQIAQDVEYVKLTENTVTTPEALLVEPEQVKDQDWAYDNAEHETFVHLRRGAHPRRHRLRACRRFNLRTRRAQVRRSPEAVATTDSQHQSDFHRPGLDHHRKDHA
jgi:DNA-binding IclR family transcriptional regulator